MNGYVHELWIPRTMWEKRRQLSAAIHRTLAIGQKMLILSCDNWTTFFGRIDIHSDQALGALTAGQIDYIQVKPFKDGQDGLGTDLSRVLGQVGQKYKDNAMDRVIVDDVDLMLDLQSQDSTSASLFALLYALRSRFQEILLFSNPLRPDQGAQHLASMRDHVIVHTPTHQKVA